MSDTPESPALTFDRSAPTPGRCETLSPLVRRLVASNGGPFTFTGTCTYLVGRGQVAVIDPGPDDPVHQAALVEALKGETVTHILVSHTHRDHSPGARALRAITGAPIAGCGPPRPSRSVEGAAASPLDASNDLDHQPDLAMSEGDALTGPGWTLTAVETPGHTANHLCFALAEEPVLFSADHVMAWSTSVIAPPDGAMGAYMASLEKLRARGETLYYPGHGGPVREPARFVRALLHHRRAREAAILNRLRAGDRRIAAMVPLLYQGLDPALFGAASLSVLAHLEDLVERGLVRTEGAPILGSEFALA